MRISYSSSIGASLATLSLDSCASSTTVNRFTLSPLRRPRDSDFSRRRKRRNESQRLVWSPFSVPFTPSIRVVSICVRSRRHFSADCAISLAMRRVSAASPLASRCFCISSVIFCICSRKYWRRISGGSSPPDSTAICSRSDWIFWKLSWNFSRAPLPMKLWNIWRIMSRCCSCALSLASVNWVS